MPDCTVNFFYREDPERGIFRQKVETRWNRIEQLGVGGFGEVWLEQKVEGPGALTARAVKLVNKARMKRYDVNFKREITALARFSKPQVCGRMILRRRKLTCDLVFRNGALC